MAANKAVSIDKDKKKKVFIAVIIIMAVVIIGLVTAVLIVLTEEERNPSPPYSYLVDGKLNYDNAAIVLDPGDQLQQEIDKVFQEVQDGYISLSHKNVAYSSDGVNFECYIQNNIDNKYDLFLNIYKDSSAQEQLLLSGLIPPGQGIDHFISEIRLDPGEYKALLVITQVEDDHATLHGDQLFLTLDLVVGQLRNSHGG